MATAAAPDLLHAFFEFGNVDIFDNAAKAALRLCNKQIKALIDATVIACKVDSEALGPLFRCDWSITSLEIDDEPGTTLSAESFKSWLFATVTKFPLLEKLSIFSCPALQALPANVGKLSHLKTLRIDTADNLTAFPPSFGQLAALEKLELCHCHGLTIEGLAPIKQLKQLRRLVITREPSNDPLILEWICDCHFPLLENLSLLNESTAFPSSLGNFKNLTSLHLSGIDITALPESIGSLSLLQKLACYMYEPFSLPGFFSKLTALKELQISPATEGLAPLQHLTGLTKLELYARMDDISFTDFLWNHTSLKALSLYDNDFLSLPDALGNLKNLEFLRLERLTRLEEIPESIGNLSCLTELKICNVSGLKRLPESIGKLVSLKSLGIKYCGVQSLPDSIGNLHALKEFKVKGCTKVIIPEPFSNLVLGKAYTEWSLKRVVFSGCGSLQICGKTMQALGLLKQYGVWRSEGGHHGTEEPVIRVVDMI